jgi:hypothetical protein
MHDPSYDDKLAFITDFIVRLPKERQVEFMEVASANAPIQQQVDIIYDHISQIVARHNSGLRPDQPKQTSEDALCPKIEVEKSN